MKSDLSRERFARDHDGRNFSVKSFELRVAERCFEIRCSTPVFGRWQARLKLLWRPRQTFTSTRLHIHGTSGYEHRNNHNPMVARWSRNPSRFIKSCKIYITRIFTEDTSFSLRVLFIKPTEDSFHLFTYLRNVKGKIFDKLIRF